MRNSHGSGTYLDVMWFAADIDLFVCDRVVSVAFLLSQSFRFPLNGIQKLKTKAAVDITKLTAA